MQKSLTYALLLAATLGLAACGDKSEDKPAPASGTPAPTTQPPAQPAGTPTEEKAPATQPGTSGEAGKALEEKKQ